VIASRSLWECRLSEKISPLERSPEVPPAVVEVRAEDAPADTIRQLLVDQLPILRTVARGLCRNAAEVEDLVHDAFEKALRSIGSVDRGQNPRGWMVTILHNLHIDRCRQRARRLPHVPCDADAIPEPEPVAVPAWSVITTDDVRRAASQLPDDLRAAYVMFALEGRSYTDVAAELGIPKATVGTRLLRARAQLKKLLSAELDTERT
jgi:RNA polymerase sigma-70 factor, ECF subfamily